MVCFSCQQSIVYYLHQWAYESFDLLTCDPPQYIFRPGRTFKSKMSWEWDHVHRFNISVTYCTTQKSLACWRHIWDTRSMRIFCKNSMHHPKCIACIFYKYLFCTVFSRKENMGQGSKAWKQEYFQLLLLLITYHRIYDKNFHIPGHCRITGPRHTLARRNARVPFIYICCLNTFCSH